VKWKHANLFLQIIFGQFSTWRPMRSARFDFCIVTVLVTFMALCRPS